MTTIAGDADGLVAADTQLTSANYILHATKVFRMSDGGVISGCGEWAIVYHRIQWHLDGEMGDPPDLRSSEVVIFRPDRTIWLGERDLPCYPILDRTIAIGCGRDIARAALARGASATEAVREAVGLDCFTGDPIQTMQVVTVPEIPGAVTYVAKKARRG